MFDRFRQPTVDLCRLAGPVILSRAGMLIMSSADAVMVGRFSAQELAYQGIAVAPFMTVMVTAFGLLSGALVMTAYEFGAGNLSQCGTVWRRALIMAMVLGLAGTILLSLGESFLLLAGQQPDIARGGGQVLAILGIGVPPLLIFVASGFLLEGTRRPLPPVVIMVFANILNIALNWLLIGGNLGSPALGAAGAAWATTGSRLFAAITIVIYIWLMDDRGRLGVRSTAIGRWRDWKQQRRIGYASGASTWIESSAFAALSMFAGLLGSLPLGAYAIAFNILSLFFMIGLGLATATAVMVGNARGRQDIPGMHLAGWTGLAVNSMGMAVLGAGLAFFPGQLAQAYATDGALILLATPLIAFSGLILISDGGQVVMANALRGRGEIWAPSVMHLIAFFGVMVPLGWFLSHRLGLGTLGLFQAIFAATVVALALLAWRFQWLASRDSRGAQV